MANATFIVDTNGIIKKLEQRGFSRTQAEGITEALKELDTSALATKADLKDLELRLYKYCSGILVAHGLRTAALTVALCSFSIEVWAPAACGGAALSCCAPSRVPRLGHSASIADAREKHAPLTIRFIHRTPDIESWRPATYSPTQNGGPIAHGSEQMLAHVRTEIREVSWLAAMAFGLSTVCVGLAVLAAVLIG